MGVAVVVDMEYMAKTSIEKSGNRGKSHQLTMKNYEGHSENL